MTQCYSIQIGTCTSPTYQTRQNKNMWLTHANTLSMKHNAVALKHIRNLSPVGCAANTEMQFRALTDKTASEAICMYNKTLDFCKLQSFNQLLATRSGRYFKSLKSHNVTSHQPFTMTSPKSAHSQLPNPQSARPHHAEHSVAAEMTSQNVITRCSSGQLVNGACPCR